MERPATTAEAAAAAGATTAGSTNVVSVSSHFKRHQGSSKACQGHNQLEHNKWRSNCHKRQQQMLKAKSLYDKCTRLILAQGIQYCVFKHPILYLLSMTV
jgi:hypothetical protein